jgi:hypothetical protein
MLVYQRVPVFDTSILSLIKPHSTAAEASAPGTAPSSDLEVAAGGTGDSPADRSWCYEWLLMVIQLIYWLMVDLPLGKMMEFVSDDYFSYIMEE